jgi:hypothetical protein
MTPEMQRMRRWAESQRAASAANARNGDFIIRGEPASTPGVVPTQMPNGSWVSGGAKPDMMPQGPNQRPLAVKPGMENQDLERPDVLPKPVGKLPPTDKSRLTGRRG